MDDPQRYESAKHFVSITGFVLDVFVLVYLIKSGLSVRIREFAEGLSHSPWISVALYMIAVGVIFKIFDLLLSFCSGYLLEHRFGLSRQSLADWTEDQLKAIAVGVPLSLAGIEVIYGLFRASPADWWLLTRFSSLSSPL